MLLMKSLFTWIHIYPTYGYTPLQWQEFHDLLILYQQIHRVRVMKLMLFIFCSEYYSVMYLLTTYTYVQCFNVFPCWLLQLHQSCVELFSFIAFLCCHCFLLLHSGDSTIYCCVISVTVIHSYKILLCLWYLANHSFMYVVIVDIKMCLLLNDISKCGEYKIA